MKVNLKSIMPQKRSMFLAYDQGLEHGPTDFNDKNVDPNFIIDLAKKGEYEAVVFQKGICEKYNKEIKKSRIPLIVKLNGKTNLFKGEPVSKQLCSVKEAVKLGAKGVGYTIYIGSIHEAEMLQEFEKIEKEAHSKGLPIIAWIYPRGKSVEGKDEGKLMAYSARVGLEIGADIVKLRYNGKIKDLRWAVQAAGRTKVMIAGGVKTGEKELLKVARGVVSVDGAGIAIGRNVWQAKDPLEITRKIRMVLIGN
jgi:fructose-bisphosphate aldolase, class I